MTDSSRRIEKVARYRSDDPRKYLSPVLAVWSGGVGLWIFARGVSGLEQGNGRAIIGIVVGWLFISIGLSSGIAATAALRRVGLSNDRLRIPRRIGSTSIDLDDIAGVGMLFEKKTIGSPGSSAWYVYFWRPDGSAVRGDFFTYRPKRFVKSGDARGRSRRFVVKGTEDELRTTSEETLRTSPAGAMAMAIYQRVLRSQGPDGNLATRQLQKHADLVAKRGSSLSAYWSPDGEMGKTTLRSI